MYDVAIIGAGPAGLSAAIACAKRQLQVVIIDEFMKPGGRLLGQLHQEPDGTWWNGIKEANILIEQAESLGVDIRCGLSVHHIEKTEQGWHVHTSEETITVPALLLATGAAESPAPVPGWTLPGVMSIGAAQVMTNVHRVRPGKKGIVIGINVLSSAITRELQLAGIEVAGMVLPAENAVTKNASHPSQVLQSLLRISHLAPSAFIRMGSKFVKGKGMQRLALTFYPKNGVKMWGIPIHLRKAVTQINGQEKVESVTLCKVSPDGCIIKGSEETIDVDFVCIAGGLYPLAELAAVSGCPFHYLPELGGHVPVHNEQMKTPLDGLYVAGNITGIESAKVARAQGTVAGLSIVKDLVKSDNSINKELEKALENVNRIRQEAVIQFHPNIHAGREKMEQIFKEKLTIGRA
ncbi:NAD(P)/FAD-dependent oxidoreductase [Scopulibacillus cellulosilyticus]|uniref:NAD(P)/FAD-dependent oxidoreductase n=1 Tax=Scopulibacillus cellulosilyticus TaxID=2665665 RepID=A0ABW2Q4A3_9BACL